VTRSIGWLPSTVARDPMLAVVPDDLGESAELLAKPSLDRGRLVIGALVQLRPSTSQTPTTSGRLVCSW